MRTKLYHTEERISSDSYSNSIQNFVTIFFAKEDEAEQDQAAVSYFCSHKLLLCHIWSWGRRDWFGYNFYKVEGFGVGFVVKRECEGGGGDVVIHNNKNSPQTTTTSYLS